MTDSSFVIIEEDGIDCPYARTEMTPCVARDGRNAVADAGVCVGCGNHPADLFKDLVLNYVSLKEAAYTDENGDLTEAGRAYVQRLHERVQQQQQQQQEARQ